MICNETKQWWPRIEKSYSQKAMQTLFSHSLALHSILLSSEPFLSFGFCVDLRVRLSRKHYMRELVGRAKQAVMSKQALIFFCRGGAYPHYYIIE